MHYFYYVRTACKKVQVILSRRDVDPVRQYKVRQPSCQKLHCKTRRQKGWNTGKWNHKRMDFADGARRSAAAL